MTFFKSVMYASVAVGAVALAMPAFAQEKTISGDDATVVVVTATKRKESLQTVPMSVDAVTGDTLAKLNVQKFEDVQKLSPGLVLNAADGRGQNVSLRGVTFDPDTGASPTVQVYWNETPISTSDAFRSLFDISQVEVLRGPQGTLRGQTSPAGAITIATQRPNLHRFEGTYNQTFGSRSQMNSQLGVSIPLIQDKLAIRLAGVYDYSENGVHNVINDRDNSDMAHGGRISLLYKPVSNFEILLVHQQLNDTNVNYQVAVGTPVSGQANGPTLMASNRASVTEGMYDFRSHSQLTSLNVSWDLRGQRLSYIGGLQQGREEDLRDQDVTNVISGWTYQQDVYAKTRQMTHELRFESTKAGFWTWMVGAYYSKNTGAATFTQPLAYYFYAPYTAPLETTLTGTTDPDNYGQNTAFFTDHRFAVTANDTIELGLRYQENKSQNQQYLSYFGLTQPALSADLTHLKSHGTTGSLSYKHTFDKDTMAYASYSKGLRPGGAVGFITAVGLDPHYYIYQPETTDSYEIGYKSKLFDRRVTFSADIFQQNIHNYIARANATWVRTAAVAGEPDGTGPGGTYPADTGTGAINFNTNGDVVSKGIEATANWLITDRWNAQISAAYIDAHYDNALLYCNDSNNDGVPDNGGAYVQPGRQVSLCASDRPLQDTFGNEAGKFNMTLRSEYSHQFGKYEGFVRGLVRYIPPSYNLALDKHISSYTPVDLYVGLRNPDQQWELSLWAQNLFDKSIDRGMNANYEGGYAGGYSWLRTAPEERKVGVTLRYNFGQ
nr:TonB-dependent receptor plug domain-containing protein [Asticcacaulis taihuensis]